MKKLHAELFRELHRKTVEPSLERRFFKLRSEGYDLLLSICTNKNASELQARNALYLISRMRFTGNQEEVFDLLIHSCLDDRVRVRSAAANLLVGLDKIAQTGYSPELKAPPDSMLAALKAARKAGLENQATENEIEEFIVKATAKDESQ